MLQEVREIWRTTSVQGFEGQADKFERYTPLNEKPMELFEELIWREWRCTRMLVQDNLSRCTLDSLKASFVLKRNAIQDRVQLIQVRRFKCWCDRDSRAHLAMNEIAWKDEYGKSKCLT